MIPPPESGTCFTTRFIVRIVWSKLPLSTPLVGVYIPIIRIPMKGGMTTPNIGSLDPGTSVILSCISGILLRSGNP